VNDSGLCFALINWHRIKREPRGRIESRGDIIPSLIGIRTSESLARRLQRMSLRRRRPFRLIAIDSARQMLSEWQWDLKVLTPRRYLWERRHWYSSGYDEREAERSRLAVCETRSLGTLASMRKLHASHLPARGPFSICMHRPDAATVSYSEVVATKSRITLRYLSGPPCQRIKARPWTSSRNGCEATAGLSSSSLRRGMLPHARLGV
jgi:hypothetical protein